MGGRCYLRSLAAVWNLRERAARPSYCHAGGDRQAGCVGREDDVAVAPRLTDGDVQAKGRLEKRLLC